MKMWGVNGLAKHCGVDLIKQWGDLMKMWGVDVAKQWCESDKTMRLM
jgi:hypothetical protein